MPQYEVQATVWLSIHADSGRGAEKRAMCLLDQASDHLQKIFGTPLGFAYDDMEALEIDEPEAE